MYKEERAISYFTQEKNFQLLDVMEFLSCSIATARRRLKKWHVYSSYNKNASYYTLPNVPVFNEYQLWHYKGAYFSKRGTLQKTIIFLIESSPAGLNVIEAGKILGMPAHWILSEYIVNNKHFVRKKSQGIYIYYSENPKIHEKQTKEREKSYNSFKQHQLPSDAESVIILVELIKHPNDTLEQLLRRTKYRGISITVGRIRNLLDYHNILKKNAD